jgi:predicted nuclease with TOPRIM domain
LSRELEAKLEEVMGEKARLAEELREANARWNAEGQRLETTQAARGDARDVSDAVKAEIARIESREREISGKIEDPSTDLGTQIRFNRERTELEAYLKGLRYSLGEIQFDNSLI